MTINLSDYIKDVQGKTILNGQCWGLAQDYLSRVLGGGELSTQGGTHPYYAIGSYTGYENNGLSKWFTKAPAGVKAQPGALAFWGWGTNFPDFSAPDSHVAIVLADKGNSVEVLSQNSGSSTAQVQTLPKEGLVGYLVPNGNTGSDTAGIQPASNTVTGNGFGDTVLGGFLSALGLDWMISPNSTFSQASGNMLTNVFLPATWVRVLSFFIGAFLIIAGIVFIVQDYKKSGESSEV